MGAAESGAEIHQEQEQSAERTRRGSPRRPPPQDLPALPAGGPKVEVRVNTLGGVEHVVHAGRHWTLGYVKKALQILTNVPSEEQRLVKGTTVLLDDAQQVSVIMGGSPIPDFPGGGGVPVQLSGSGGGASSSTAPATHSGGERQGGLLELTLVYRTSQQVLWLQRVSSLGVMLCDVPRELKADRELVLAAVKKNVEAFQYADAALQADRSFMLAAVQLNAAVLPYASSTIRSDREIVLAAVSRRGEVLACVGPELRRDQEVVLQAVKQHGLAFRHASDSLRDDRAVAIAAAEQNPGAVAYASESLRRDREVLLAALRSKACALKVEMFDPFQEMDGWTLC